MSRTVFTGGEYSGGAKVIQLYILWSGRSAAIHTSTTRGKYWLWMVTETLPDDGTDQKFIFQTEHSVEPSAGRGMHTWM